MPKYPEIVVEFSVWPLVGSQDQARGMCRYQFPVLAPTVGRAIARALSLIKALEAAQPDTLTKPTGWELQYAEVKKGHVVQVDKKKVYTDAKLSVVRLNP